MGFKICVVGCGHIANAMHGHAYVKYAGENPDAVFAGCCDIDPERAKAFQSKFGFANAYTDMDDMLKKEKPDAVCLLSPVEVIAGQAAKILELGVPLLLEKPPGRTLGEASGLAEVAARKNTPHRVAFNRRYAPLIRELRASLSAVPPGDIQSLQYDMLRVGRTDGDFSTTAIHAIDAVRFLAGSDYRHIRFTYREYPELGGNVTDIHMMCEMKSGTIVKLNICPVTGITAEGAVVCLHDSTYYLDHMSTPLSPAGRLTKIERNSIVMDITANDTLDGTEPFEREGFYYENKSFFDDIIAGRKPSGTLDTALQTVDVANCIRERRNEYFSE